MLLLLKVTEVRGSATALTSPWRQTGAPVSPGLPKWVWLQPDPTATEKPSQHLPRRIAGCMGETGLGEVEEVPGLLPAGGREAGAGHQRVGRPASRPQGQVAFVRTGQTQSGQGGALFTFRPTGVTTEPRHSLLHDKGGIHKGQAAPH